jgi:hypothetical protein
MLERYLKHPAVDALEGLGRVGLGTLGGDRQRTPRFELTSAGNASKSFCAPFSHEIKRVFRIQRALTNLSTPCQGFPEEFPSPHRAADVVPAGMRLDDRTILRCADFVSRRFGVHDPLPRTERFGFGGDINPHERKAKGPNSTTERSIVP